MTAKEKLRDAIDDLTEAEAADALDFLARRQSAPDRLGEVLVNAPDDDEPTFREEDEGALEARDEIARGEVFSAEQVRREIA